jgi:DNA-binding MarR family transcriptional regulator
MSDQTSDTPLTPAELRCWHALKAMGQHVRDGVGRDIAAATGLSDPDFGVLSRLEDLGGGELRQQDLADRMGWHRSRLSHHLTRMEERGLVRRTQASDRAGVTVAITPDGARLLAAARPVHAAAVRSRLLEVLDAKEREALERIAAKLLSTP